MTKKANKEIAWPPAYGWHCIAWLYIYSLTYTAHWGVRRTAPVGIIAAESALPPARALLDHRQARFALRLLARPRGGGGQEEILEKRSGLTARIKERCGLGRRETAEAQVWEEFKVLRAEVHVERKEDALRTAKEWSDQLRTVWADGSRLENGR